VNGSVQINTQPMTVATSDSSLAEGKGLSDDGNQRFLWGKVKNKIMKLFNACHYMRMF
jgi:hypothetical protein